MTAAIEALGFHIGLVVHDGDATVAAYRDLLGGVTRTWHTSKERQAAVREDLEPSELKISYGRYGGMTIEVIEVLSGRCHYAHWLERHGDGVQHLGFWVRDVAAATRAALERGATLTSATIDPGRLMTTTVANASPHDAAGAILPGSVFLGYTTSSVEVEFLGPPMVDALNRRLGDQFDDIAARPLWN